MGEMLTYIFSSLRSSEKRLDVVTRAVSKQRSFNKQITIFAALTTANLVVMKIEQKDQALEKIEQYGYISINDPCCGAGATLIAGVHVIRKQLEHCDPPRNYQNHILVVAQDVDEIVGLMCYIQISLLGLAGFIKIGNSISDPMSTDDSSENYWYTPMYFSDVWSTRRMLRQINKLFG